MLLLLEQLAPVGQLGDPAEVHDRDPVADVLDDAHVVGDEHVGQAELALELLEQVQDLRLDRHVEGRDGLVADDEVGLEDERPGDPDALALAAGELVWVAAGVPGRQADEVHHPTDLLVTLGGGPDPVDPQALADAVDDRRPRVEARIGVLEDHLHAASVGLEGRALERRQLRPVEPDRARRGFDQAEQQAPDRRLATARLADQAQGLAPADVEVHPVDRLDRPDRALEDAAVDREVLDEAADPDEWLGLGAGRGRAGRTPAAPGTVGAGSEGIAVMP